MNLDDTDGAQAVRQRLRHAADSKRPLDSAIRIESIDAPVDGSRPLLLHLGFTVVGGLSEQASRAIAATINALGATTHDEPLSCIVRVDGVPFSMRSSTEGFSAHGDRLPDWPTGGQARDPIVASSESGSLADLVEALTASIALTSAELRGATTRAQELRADSPAGSADAGLDRQDRTDLREVLDTVADVLPDTATIAELRQALNEITTKDRANERLVGLLGGMGLAAAPDRAEEMAAQILDEADELEMVKRRLEAKLGEGESDGSSQVTQELPRVEMQQQNLRHVLNARKRILGACRAQLAVATRSSAALQPLSPPVAGPTDEEGRSVPILIEDPLAGIPIRLGATLLSVLLRLSETMQVICVSDLRDLDAWCKSVGDRAAHVDAHGWFAGN